MSKANPSGWFYGWVIVLACFLITFAGMGAVNSMSGVLLKPICDSLGFTRGEFTFHRTIMTLLGALLLPLYGRLFGKIGVKKVLLISSIAIAAVTFAYSMAAKLWHFYILALLNGVFIGGPGFMTTGYLINNWFVEKRSLATGIAYAGAGIGTAALIPVVGFIAENQDWQSAYRIIGGLIFVILLPTVLFLVRERPQDLGLEPYGNEADAGTDAALEARAVGMTLGQALRTPQLWSILVAFFLLSITAGGPNFNAVAYLTDIGYSATFASVVMSAMMLMHMAGNISLGGVFDRFGMFFGSALLSLCCIVFPLFALRAQNPACIWLFALVYGIASAGFAAPASTFVSTYFGQKHFAAIFSVLSLATQLGTALSGPSMGVIYDVTGNYFWGWIMLFAFGIIIAACLIGAHLLHISANRRVETAADAGRAGAND